MAQLVKKTPFQKGYSDQLRTEMDFGDFDEKEFSETPDEFKKRFKESSPANKFKYKTPIAQAEAMLDDEYDSDYERSWGPDKTKLLKKLAFEKMDDDKLLHHFLSSSGFGFTGSHKNGNFTFNGPDWDKKWNPMSRQKVIDELNERKRIDLEDDGDWFEYIESLEDI